MDARDLVDAGEEGQGVRVPVQHRHHRRGPVHSEDRVKGPGAVQAAAALDGAASSAHSASIANAGS